MFLLLTCLCHIRYFWCVIEYNTALMCACAPSLRVFAKRYLQKSSPSSTRNRTPAAPDDLSSFRPYPTPMGIIRRSEISMYSIRTPRPDSRAANSEDKAEKAAEEEKLVPPLPPSPGFPSPVHRSKSIKTPQEYEEYMLQVIETSRSSVSAAYVATC